MEPRPQEGIRRHTGEAYELVLDPVVPQLGRDLTVLPDPEARKFFEALEAVSEASGRDVARDLQDMLAQAAERQEGQREQEDAGARSSNKMGKKGKRRKKRKKKLPKGSSSSPRPGVGDQGTMIEYAEDEQEEIAGYSGRWETAPCMAEMNKYIEEKGIGSRELIQLIHKHGQTEVTLYSDRLHLYSQSSGRCWLIWMKSRRRYVRRMGCLRWWTVMLLTDSDSLVCYEELVEQTLSARKTVKDLTWLFLYVPPGLEFQL